MPTPSHETLVSPLGLDRNYRFLQTCPPDDDRQNASGTPRLDATTDTAMVDQSVVAQHNPETVADAGAVGQADLPNAPSWPIAARSEYDDDTIARDTPSPMSTLEDVKDARPTISQAILPTSASTPPPPTFQSSISSSPQAFPLFTSSFLRNGSKFAGTQKSDRQVYNVQVEIKHVDMSESFICGYLRIEGLTTDHPTLTTYFEGEIVGNKYAFQTRHADWGSNEKVDMHHWNLFPSFRPLKAQAKRSDFTFRNFAQREHIYMRWKEYFLVPDHRVRTISGASFEGFYYICFNQKTGFIEGFYFHHKSEKHQQLKLDHVTDRGCMGAMELR